jgi:uncharacterized protein
MRSYNYNNPGYPGALGQSYAGSRSISDIMRLVYLWVAAGLVICFGVSFFVAATASPLLFNPVVSIVALVAYIGLAFTFYPIIRRVSVAFGAVLYLAFAAVFGLLISAVWYEYATGTIFRAFITTAAMFGIMSIIGFTTKLDLSRLGAIFLMALIGLIVASIINIFLASSVLYFIISLVGVVIFCGLITYDTQWIKRNAGGLVTSGDGQAIGKLALVGAFHLFMDFVNLFLFLLELFGMGSRR